MAGTIELFTDGACSGNPGPGGYGAILRYGSYEKEFSQGFLNTTNNRMELMAVIIGLESIKWNHADVVVYSDSSYVVNTINKGWIDKWLNTNFKGKANKDLWLRYLDAAEPHNVSFVWLKGHAGHPENERCDSMAVEAYKSENLIEDKV